MTPLARTPRRRSWRTVCRVAAMLALAACDEKGKVAEGSAYASKVAALIPRIEQVTGMTFKTPPRVATKSAEEVKAFLAQQFAESKAATELEGQEQAYKLLGLIPYEINVKRLYLELLAEQVVGYYEPKAKTLYVVEGAAPEAVGITLAHELVHALQDQYVNLDSIQQAGNDNDRASATQAVIEGHATYEQMILTLGGDKGNGSLADKLPGGWDMIRQQIRDAKNQMPKLSAAPMLVQETLLFPYLAGAEYVRAYEAAKGRGNPFAHIPQSTRQVLHSAKFIAAGDAYQVVKTPKGNAIVWLVLFDTPVEAAEFLDLANQTVVKRWDPKEYLRAGPDGKRWVEGGREMLVKPVSVGGHAGVLWIDNPVGARVELDAARATLVRAP
ncbi:MAG: hypothetical protein HY275_01005 [Gemmatimonadetes bacterium]|nr:hypothetical protein [Gemmatimonadota bacterium]